MGRILLRRLQVASFFGAIWSYWFGGSVALYFFSIILSWLWGWFAYAACHYVLVFIPARAPSAVPSLWGYVLAPNWIFGLIWLCYYLGAFLAPTKRNYDDGNGTWLYQYQVFQDEQKRTPPAHSKAWKGEQKQRLVQACYDAYRQALTRFDPPPVTDLQLPKTFFHRPENSFEWQLTTESTYLPTLPEELLTPEGIHTLMPLLAHHLYWYQTLDAYMACNEWNSSPEKAATWLTLTGNGLWLPVLVKTMNETRLKAWLISEVHAADRFAYWLGQGPALLHILRVVEAELKRRGEKDRSVPTLLERIGQLEALVAQEEDRMRKLGVPIPPLQAHLSINLLPVRLLPAPKTKKSESSTQRSFLDGVW